MKLIAFTRPDFFAGEGQCLNALLAEGLWRLHLRKPSARREQAEQLLAEIAPDYRDRVVLHNFAQGVSHSCHTLAEVTQWKPFCQYVFLSPIFDSISKAGYQSAFSRESLQEAHRQGTIDHRVVALGGISPQEIPLCHALGFGGVAVLGWLWQHKARCDDSPHIASYIQELTAHLRSLQHTLQQYD